MLNLECFPVPDCMQVIGTHGSHSFCLCGASSVFVSTVVRGSCSWGRRVVIMNIPTTLLREVVNLVDGDVFSCSKEQFTIPMKMPDHHVVIAIRMKVVPTTPPPLV